MISTTLVVTWSEPRVYMDGSFVLLLSGRSERFLVDDGRHFVSVRKPAIVVSRGSHRSEVALSCCHW